MLSPILSKNDCAGCRFCCSFRRASLWEIPIFTAENIEAIRKYHPGYLRELNVFVEDGLAYATYDLSGRYRTESTDEESPCPFLNPDCGCILSPEEKPFDCKVWPLRALKFPDGTTCVALAPTCRVINGLDIEVVRSFVARSLGKEILLYAEAHPFLYKTDNNAYICL